MDHSNQNVLCGSEDGFVYVWDLLTAGVTAKLPHGQERASVTSLSHHHEQPRLVTAARADLFFWEKKEDK